MIFKRKAPNLQERSEKRGCERVYIFQPSYFMYQDPSRQIKTESCWVNNISMGGVCIDVLDKSIDIGDEIKVMYQTQTKIRTDKFIIKHITRVLNNFRCGCEFLDSDNDRDKLIEKYISNYVA